MKRSLKEILRMPSSEPSMTDLERIIEESLCHYLRLRIRTNLPFFGMYPAFLSLFSRLAIA
tara:strand:- start:117 stop:299 length:183 start_codon:yes stop_codon:yes gene_type:complete